MCAALLLDVGSSIDFYNRYDRVAAFVTRSDLPGFTHRECAQIASILLAAGDEALVEPFLNSTVLTPTDKRFLGQASAILLATDEMERRLAPEIPAECVTISQEAAKVETAFTITTPSWTDASAPYLYDRWEREFRQPLRILRGKT